MMVEWNVLGDVGFHHLLPPEAECRYPPRRTDATGSMKKDSLLVANCPFLISNVQCSILVRAGAVDAGDGDVEEAEVDAELGPVVDDVAEDEFSQDFLFGAGEEDLFTGAHGPIAVEDRVGGLGDHALGVGETLVTTG